MKSLTATLCTLAAAAGLLLTAPVAADCGEENTCNNRPEIADARADAPQTRALKKKPKMEECDENFCN